MCHVSSSQCVLLLQESLGGNARTSLVVAVADAIEHCDETLQSLQFGTRAMCVENVVGTCAHTTLRFPAVGCCRKISIVRKLWWAIVALALQFMQQHCRPVGDALLQAVVNEKTDDAVTHQQLLLEMEEQAGRADQLSRSLIDKESALGSLERKLEVHACFVRVIEQWCCPPYCQVVFDDLIKLARQYSAYLQCICVQYLHLVRCPASGLSPNTAHQAGLHTLSSNRSSACKACGSHHGTMYDPSQSFHETSFNDHYTALQDERKANEGIMQALDRERQQALAAQQRAMEQHLAELDAERQHQADLAAQLSQTQVTSWTQYSCKPPDTLA
jgi:hypothetical protein